MVVSLLSDASAVAPHLQLSAVMNLKNNIVGHPEWTPATLATMLAAPERAGTAIVQADVLIQMIISAVGIIVCLFTSFLATHIYPVTEESRIELALRLQLIVSCILLIPTIHWAAYAYLPESFVVEGVSKTLVATPFDAFACVISGTVGGLVIGLTTEYYTSKEYTPVRELVIACKTGAATNIIHGLALRYLPVVVSVFMLAFNAYLIFAN